MNLESDLINNYIKILNSDSVKKFVGNIAPRGSGEDLEVVRWYRAIRMKTLPNFDTNGIFRTGGYDISWINKFNWQYDGSAFFAERVAQYINNLCRNQNIKPMFRS